MLLIFSSIAARAQSAEDCGNGDAPGSYDNEACNNICVVDVLAASQLVCDLAANGGTFAAPELTAAWSYFGYPGAQYLEDRYSFWGIDGAGDDFCCVVDDQSTQNITVVEIYGTDETDLISLSYGDPSRDLKDLYYGLYVLVDGWTDGDDVMFGSSASGNYIESFWASDGNNTIRTYQGNDYITGGNGDDFLDGGVGNDEIFGADGNDVIQGGNGADRILGGAGDDCMCGGGGTGDEFDEIFGSGNDTFWAPAGSVDMYAFSSTDPGDHCGDTELQGDWAGPDCDYDLDTKPDCCP
jgi:hypothetical protein